MLRHLISYLRAEPLRNTGSLARDLLASERTFLAWARTGLGFIALGVALEKVEALATLAPALLQLEDSRTKVAAGILVAGGSICVAHGTHRYFSTLRLLKEGYFRPNVPGITLTAAASIAIAFSGTLLVLENEQRRSKRAEKANAASAV